MSDSEQLGREDLKRMSPEAIVQAQRDGRCRELLAIDRTSPYDGMTPEQIVEATKGDQS